jgi:hypothetical protein
MFQGVKSHEKPFSAFMALKKASLTNSLKWFLSRRMALRTHDMTTGRLKKRLWYVDEAMFQGVERPREIILCIQGFEKVTWTMSLKWCFK